MTDYQPGAAAERAFLSVQIAAERGWRPRDARAFMDRAVAAGQRGMDLIRDGLRFIPALRWTAMACWPPEKDNPVPEQPVLVTARSIPA